jgi:thymidylate synthase (FAD)
VKDNEMGLSQIKVELVDYMGDDLSTVNSARVSFDKESEDLSDKDTKLVKYLADHKHLTPFRHNAIQLRCTAPIFLARQLGKHQAGLSWNEVSRRYVDTPPEFYTPDNWLDRPNGSIKQGSGGVHFNSKAIDAGYGELVSEIAAYYEDLISNGVAPEQARMVLPQSMLTTWIWSGNLLAFNHVYKERIAEGAQLAAQHFAKELGVILEQLFPVSFRALKGEL